MSNINKIKKNVLHMISLSHYITQNISSKIRFLESNNQVIDEQKRKENQKKQIYELLIYLGILFGIIIIILGGYNLYKRYLERQLIEAVNRENQNLMNYHNSISGASQEERQIYSFNGKIYNKYIGSEIESYNAQNNSFDYNHEERMEKIRKKYGNKMLIKILIKQQIDTVTYNKNLGLEYGDNCTICVNNFIENIEIYRTPCEHIFHKECFNKYLKTINKKSKLTCPNCNQNLLINKKFLKLRNETKKINIKKIKIKNNSNINDIENIDTDKKDLSDNGNISTYTKNMQNNIIEVNKAIMNKNREPIIILKKRRMDIPNNIKHAATTDHKYINIYKPNDYFGFKNKKSKDNEEELHITNSDIDENDIVDKKKNKINPFNSGNIGNNLKIENNILNLNIIRDKKKKLSHGKIIFSEVENGMNNNQINTLELNSKRGFIDDKIMYNNNNDNK